MRIELDAPGRIPGDEMMNAVRASFNVRDWTRICINVDGEGFLLGDLGAPDQMMKRLTDLEDGGKVSVEIPDDIEFDLEATRARLTATLTAWDKGVEVFKRRVERGRQLP